MAARGRRPPRKNGGVAAGGSQDEVRALGALAFRELAGVPGGIRDVHDAVAERVFRGVGRGAAPVRAVHDLVSAASYSAVRGTMRAAGRAADAGLARRRVSDPRLISGSPPGALALGALTGLIGDALEREGSALHAPMAVRLAGRPIAPDPEALAAAFPDASGRIAVFIHGLMETELAWRAGAGPGGETYGSRLRHDLGYSPLELRYNSGLHISENGRELADLMERLAAAWPAEVERIALIGHSMGGLVARSACHQGSERGDAWVTRVRHVVSLGSPHLGAPLAQGVHWLSAALHAVPETRPLARFLRRRSAGIRDLRHGSLVDDDWSGRDPDALRAVACREVPLLEGATHCFVAATITKSGRHPLGRLLGDCLVLESSASGRSRTRRIPFQAEHGLHVGGTHHIALLNHPLVYERLRAWLAPPA
jgi:pimeloyl-ACP methyl ester carboxylesterase